ncbi:MAG: hypothetical protein EU530_05615 [Promethearchaeota archaeon]|nr:MAG: hypothetical protein EU530_05615 [Candidatus Lokiarchaeota archaeon]
MTSNIDEIEKKALKLSVQERAMLIRQLIESLDEGDEDLNAEKMWFDEAKKRYCQYKDGKTLEKEASEVFKDAKASLR